MQELKSFTTVYFAIHIGLFCLMLIIKVLKNKSLLKRLTWLSSKLEVVFVINFIFSVSIIGICVVGILGNGFDYLRHDRHLVESKNPVVYTLAHLKETEWISNRGNSHYKGTLFFQIGNNIHEEVYKLPYHYEDYIYLVKINTQNPKYSSIVPFLIQDISPNTLFYMHDTQEVGSYVGFPILEKNIPSYLHTINVNNIVAFELFSTESQNLVQIPLTGWKDNPSTLFIQGNEQQKTKYIYWLIITVGFFTAVYSIYSQLRNDRKNIEIS